MPYQSLPGDNGSHITAGPASCKHLDYRFLPFTFTGYHAVVLARCLFTAQTHSQVHCTAGVDVLHTCSAKVEEAVKELLHMLRSTALLPRLTTMDSEDMAKSNTGIDEPLIMI